ncbi:hypothetical protein AB0M46_46850 [Dactylosporangium sp. NPDC051485]|uniref:hypothetical protein n=1 Tax=Dactylosporangium sp. NPDC051485 TaxID=3154846 RepID=UPI00341CB997
MCAFHATHVVTDVPAESADTVRTAVGDIAFTSVALTMSAGPHLNILVSTPRTAHDRTLLTRLRHGSPAPPDVISECPEPVY